jgi:branched-subunit amino acid transport protein AzlD
MRGYAIVFLVSAVSVFSRAIPFLLLRGAKSAPLMEKAAQRLPCSLMGLLVVFALRGHFANGPASAAAAAAASLACVLSFLWKKSYLASILIGTAVFMILSQRLLSLPGA